MRLRFTLLGDTIYVDSRSAKLWLDGVSEQSSSTVLMFGVKIKANNVGFQKVWLKCMQLFVKSGRYFAILI